MITIFNTTTDPEPSGGALHTTLVDKLSVELQVAVKHRHCQQTPVSLSLLLHKEDVIKKRLRLISQEVRHSEHTLERRNMLSRSTHTQSRPQFLQTEDTHILLVSCPEGVSSLLSG